MSDFEAALHDYMHSEQKELMAEIQEKAAYTEAVEAALTKSLEDFKQNHTW